MTTERVEHMAGGQGHALVKRLLDEKQLNGKCKLYAQVTLEPGCSLGYHEHHNESETYYILSGKGIYSDNGTLRMVQAGDVTFTPDGKGHGLTNSGDEDLVFMALIILEQECERYGSTWACPPAVGTLKECEERIRKFGQAVFFSSVAEVSDLMNMQEMLQTRAAHEELTTEVARFLKEQGFETFTLSTESCDICEDCAYPHGKPCRHPDRMHPCLESHGVVVSEIVEKQQMEYNLGGNTILWFSMVLFK